MDFDDTIPRKELLEIQLRDVLEMLNDRLCWMPKSGKLVALQWNHVQRTELVNFSQKIEEEIRRC